MFTTRSKRIWDACFFKFQEKAQKSTLFLTDHEPPYLPESCTDWPSDPLSLTSVLRGHRVTVASHECGKDWVDKVHGARFVSLGAAPLTGDARRAKFKQVRAVQSG